MSEHEKKKVCSYILHYSNFVLLQENQLHVQLLRSWVYLPMLVHLLSFHPRSDPRDVHSRALEDVVAQDICFALLVGRHGAGSEVDGSVGACAAALGERAWVDAED